MEPSRILLLGATGTIGCATLDALKAEGHRVVAPVRDPHPVSDDPNVILWHARPEDAFREHAIDAVISCVATRTGLDAWEVDYGINSAVLKAAIEAGTRHYVLLSAICVQKPRLAFQHAKLAFETELQAAPLGWSIVRPTAYFKSLSGQIDRLRRGKPYLLFGDGELTACKPISDRDTARYLVRCLSDPGFRNRILPIGGPGPALTPRAQGHLLFDALGLTPRFRHVPVGMMRAIGAGLAPFGPFSRTLGEKRELARIGTYYATESMLVWDPIAGRYDPDATPEFGSEKLADHFQRLASLKESDVRGAHAVF